MAIGNFFNLETQLIKIFCVLSLLAIPQMIAFYSFNDNTNDAHVSILDKISFSSMGQANTLCSKAPNLPNQDGFKLYYECDNHYVVTTEVFNAGLLGHEGSFDANLYSMSTICYLDEVNE